MSLSQVVQAATHADHNVYASLINLVLVSGKVVHAATHADQNGYASLINLALVSGKVVHVATHADHNGYSYFGATPETKEIGTHICSCHNFFPLSSVQIMVIPACCLLCVL